MAEEVRGLTDEELDQLAAAEEQGLTDEQLNALEMGGQPISTAQAGVRSFGSGGGLAKYIEAGARSAGEGLRQGSFQAAKEAFPVYLDQARRYWEEEPEAAAPKLAATGEIVGGIAAPIPGTGPISKATAKYIMSGKAGKWAAKQTTKWLADYKPSLLKKVLNTVPGKSFIKKSDDIGDFAVKENLIGKTYEETESLAAKAADTYGSKTSEIVKNISDTSGMIPTNRIYDKIETEVISKLEKIGAADEAKILRNQLLDLTKKPVQSLEDLDNFKKLFNQEVVWDIGRNLPAKQKMANNAMKRASGIINETIETAIETASKNTPRFDEYITAKDSYKKALAIKKLAEANKATEYVGKKARTAWDVVKQAQGAALERGRGTARGIAGMVGKGELNPLTIAEVPIRGAIGGAEGLMQMGGELQE